MRSGLSSLSPVRDGRNPTKTRRNKDEEVTKIVQYCHVLHTLASFFSLSLSVSRFLSGSSASALLSARLADFNGNLLIQYFGRGRAQRFLRLIFASIGIEIDVN